MDKAFLQGFNKIAVRWISRVAPAVGLGTAGAIALSGTEGEARDALKKGGQNLSVGFDYAADKGYDAITSAKRRVKAGKQYVGRKIDEVKGAIK